VAPLCPSSLRDLGFADVVPCGCKRLKDFCAGSPACCPGNWPGWSAASPSARSYFSCCGIHPWYRWYGPVVPKSPILPLAAAVTAVALSASPAQATPLLAGKRDDVKVVAFPLLAVKGQLPASVGGHVSHSSHQSHVSGSGGGHASHVSHHSHVSSVPAPTSVATGGTQAPPPASPTPAASAEYSGGSSAAVPSSGSLASSSADLASGSPATSNGGGCAFVVVAPFTALVGWIRRLARRGRAR